tara:strand:+ start:218 stop:2128 length:1911 start_codon:yes stop_codon:yes gene_type:complete
MVEIPVKIVIEYMDTHRGLISINPNDLNAPIWSRIKLSIRSKSFLCTETKNKLELSWPDTLALVREFGSKHVQKDLSFRLSPTGNAIEKIKDFSIQYKRTKLQQDQLSLDYSSEDIKKALLEKGFVRRELKSFQIEDLRHLLSLSNGANFSVPGAGKTTVTFALHLLVSHPDSQLIVVAPKSANQSWVDVVEDCIDPAQYSESAEAFTILDGTEADTVKALNSGKHRFLISYDLMIRQQSALASHLAANPVHLVLDESHRMKAGWDSQRGAFLLQIADLPVRRDILTGTPMPQGASDIESQLDFLWPGHGLGLRVVQGQSPKIVLGNLFVRTTKQQLGLPKKEHHLIDIDMKPGQLALYSIVRNEIVRDFSNRSGRGLGDLDVLKARRSVMRLLQLSVNPAHALTAMANDDYKIESGIVEQVIEEGHSAKLEAVMDKARQLAAIGEKSVIWTIFTDTILGLSSALADLNPVCVYGAVPSGSKDDPSTREGKIHRFHIDDSCKILIANPAAASEGISLHTVCHNALYADRSYVSTHFLQSIDRIHRLGLDINQSTDIHIFRSKAPPIIGSVDASVSRRLTEKIRKMQELLDDPDLHQIALYEEEADDPVDYDLELDDLIDLIAELEGRAPSAKSENE